jgi:hypothetical protein
MGADVLFWDFRDKKVGDKMSAALIVVVGAGKTVLGLDGDIRRAKDRRDGAGDGISTLTSGAVRWRDNVQAATNVGLARRADLSDAFVSVNGPPPIRKGLIIVLRKNAYLYWRWKPDRLVCR